MKSGPVRTNCCWRAPLQRSAVSVFRDRTDRGMSRIQPELLFLSARCRFRPRPGHSKTWGKVPPVMDIGLGFLAVHAKLSLPGDGGVFSLVLAQPLAVARTAGRQSFYTLFQHTIIPYLRGFQSGRWHANVQARTKKNPGAHANGCRDVCAHRIVVRVILLDRADKPLTADGVNPLALRVEIHIVGRSAHRNSRNLFASIGIKYDQQRRSPGDDEEPVIVFIERHWIVCFGSVQLPLGQPAGFPVDNIDHTVVVRYVDEYTRPIL